MAGAMGFMGASEPSVRPTIVWSDFIISALGDYGPSWTDCRIPFTQVTLSHL